MKKKIGLIVLFFLTPMMFVLPLSASAESVNISAEKKTKIAENCESIRESLVDLQHRDSRARVYLGRYYQAILSDFIVPLNVSLLQNSQSDAKLIENQNDFTNMRGDFTSDYIKYQKDLEELIAIDCTNEPEKFYEKLTSVREKRAMVEKDTVRLRELMSQQVKLVKDLRDSL